MNTITDMYLCRWKQKMEWQERRGCERKNVRANPLPVFLEIIFYNSFRFTEKSISGEFLGTPHSINPIITSFTLILVIINEPINWFRFPQVLPKDLFLFQDPMQDAILHLVVMSPWAPLGCDGFSDFPDFFMTLTALVRYFVECPSVGIYLMIFS